MPWADLLDHGGQKAEPWLEEMKAKGLVPSVLAYTAPTDACAKALDVPRAVRWQESMQAASIEPNVASYSARINACAEGGRFARTEH